MDFRARSWTNFSGLLLSIACVIHCMLMPLCLASLPAWGLEWLVSPLVHQSLALVGIGIGMATLIPGWRNHRRTSVLLIAFIGLGIMNYAAFAGGDCCSKPVAGSGCGASSCCHSTGCPAPTASTPEGPNSTASSIEATVGWLEGSVTWYWSHPTALGALLLAWAHCLNGGCTRKCCQQRSEAPVQLNSPA